MFAHSQPLGSEGRDEGEEALEDDGTGTDGALYLHHGYTSVAGAYLPDLSLEVELDHRGMRFVPESYLVPTLF